MSTNPVISPDFSQPVLQIIENQMRAAESQVRVGQEALQRLAKAKAALLADHALQAAPRPLPDHPVTVADAAEVLLAAARGPMEVNLLARALWDSHQIRITAKNLSNTLNRWVTRGKRFARVRPNTYAVLGK